MKKINVALIGCGYWGSKLRRYLEEYDSFNLVKVCNSKTNLDIVWQDKSIQAVVVATPMDTHFRIVWAALNAKKNVLCEKPLAPTAPECDKLRRTALARNRLLMVDYTFTFSRSLLMAQRMVKDGEIGKVLGLELVMKQWGRFNRGGVHWLLTSHMLAILDMFLPLSDLSFARLGKRDTGDEAVAAFFPFQGKGVSGLISVSLRYPGKVREVIIYGEKGAVVYDGVGRPSLRIGKGEGYLTEWEFSESDNLRLVIEHFHRALEGKAKSNVDRAVEVTSILEGLVDN